MIRNVVFAALAFLGACNTPDSMETGIVGSWRIEDVDGGGVIDSSRLEIQFDADGRVSGHSGCNAFTGPYTRNGAAIDIGPLASTRRACAEALMLQEARVLATLDAVASLVQTADGAIVLSGPAPARLLLRRMDDAPPADAGNGHIVTGEVSYIERIALPPGAVLRVTAQDVARVDAAAPTLAQIETPATNGPPFAFRLDVPRDRLTPQSQVAVRAQILSGSAILFTSTEHHGVAFDGATLRIRVSPVEAASGAGGRPVTPTPTTYICGGETLRIAIEEGAAYVTFADGETLRLERLRAAGEDQEAPRLFTNGRMTIRQNIEGPEPRVSFARGRAALLPCMRG